MHHKHIIKSLPLLASILGRKYGVQVRIGGDRAYTNGNVIQLPGLPLDSDDTLLGLIRGYIDHESAHIRDTDFQALKAAALSPFEKHIWNIIEDWRAENALAAVYPGCRENFQWLIRHLFLPQPPKSGQQQASADPATQILNWLLITVRSWDVHELAKERDLLRATVEIHFPGLTHELEPILRQIQTRCSSTRESIATAREITTVIRKYAHFFEQQQKQQSGQAAGATANGSSGSADAADPGRALQSLQKMLTSGAGKDYTADIGEKLKDALADASQQQVQRLRVATATNKHTYAFPQNELTDSRQATTALRTRLQALMQSTRTVRNHDGYSGMLNTHKLHTLAAGNAKIFLRRGERIGVNTAAHILLDASGSMSGTSMTLASQACFAVATALCGIKGISVGVTAFPGSRVPDYPGQPGHWNTVAPILGHKEKMHTAFGMTANGNTPMDSALWWVLQQMYPMPEPRKLILLITDGAPDSKPLALEAIAEVRRFHFEVYGIGIADASIQSLLPGKDSKVIGGIAELAKEALDRNGATTPRPPSPPRVQSSTGG